ncbi:MAG TPA: hypothetical protein VFO16_06525 [Pseudonocardiaceae bacterium]|nr:hypothetical protein [Pseudonocardiaceae bacterium]
MGACVVRIVQEMTHGSEGLPTSGERDYAAGPVPIWVSVADKAPDDHG